MLVKSGYSEYSNAVLDTVCVLGLYQNKLFDFKSKKQHEKDQLTFSMRYQYLTNNIQMSE